MLKYKIPQIVTLTRIDYIKDMIDTKKARQTVCLTGFCFISD